MADQAQKSRSVYIGNLPFEMKEDGLKKLFSQVGTIVSLRMPYDPENNKSRGFAFCEFREQESVPVAIKHFHGYELDGRKIKVDSALNNADKDARLPGPALTESQYGEPCDPVKAPENIAQVVGHMSPQQIQALISEAKRCLQCDPDEARVALVNNPQITYALLLALVRGRFITKERGTEALAKPEAPLLPLFPETRPPLLSAAPPLQHVMPSQPLHPMAQPIHSIHTTGTSNGHSPSGAPPPSMYNQPSNVSAHSQQSRGVPPPRPFPEPMTMQPPPRQHQHHYNDSSSSMGGSPVYREPLPPHRQQPERPPPRKYNEPVDRQAARKFNEPHERPPARRYNEPVEAHSRPYGGTGATRGGYRENGRAGDPCRQGEHRGVDRSPRFDQNDRSPVTRSPLAVSPPPPSSTSTSREEQEKAELIMQVLNLKEEDIAKMAPEQQATVRKWRDQFKS